MFQNESEQAVRIAHFSDLHYATKTLTEVDRCFGYAVEQAIALRVDAAVISGDATDHQLDLHAPAVDALARRVRRLALPFTRKYPHHRKSSLEGEPSHSDRSSEYPCHMIWCPGCGSLARPM